MPAAVILAHREQANDLGLIGEWLESHGWEFSRIWREDASEWPDADLMIVLGSLSSIAAGYCAPWTDREIEQIRAWVGCGRPYLGVCFGAQALAVALGGAVERMPEFFRSVTSIEWSDGKVRGPWVVWHEDAIMSVGSAEVVGSLPHAIVAFRFGSAWGVQPHVELDGDAVEALARQLDASDEVWQPLAEGARAQSEELRAATFALLDEVTRT
ncbi:MAG: type 1 glutamine amidotransferase [Actinomycetota bacterium]